MQNKNDPAFSECNKSAVNPNEEKNSIELAPPDYIQSQLTQADHYPSGYNNPQFDQIPCQYPMGINNPQFNQLQDLHSMGINNPQFNQPQAQYPMGVSPQINLDMTKGDKNLVNQPQTNQVFKINANSTIIAKEEIPFVQHPPSYKCLALFSCLCCFWPLGLFALCKSYEVDSAFMEGNHVKSQAASASARRYALISIGLGVVLTCLVFALNVIRFSAS